MIFLFKTVFFIVSIVSIYNVIIYNEINIYINFKILFNKTTVFFNNVTIKI